MSPFHEETEAQRGEVTSLRTHSIQVLEVLVLSCSVVSDSLRRYGLQSARLLCPWDSPGKKTGVGCHALLQGISQNQGLNPGLLYYRWILYHLSHQGSPRILEWVAYPFSIRTSELLNSGIELGSPALQADSLPAELPEKPRHHLSGVA